MGRNTATEATEADRKFLALLPMLVAWIEKDRQLTEREIAAFIRQYPFHFGLAANRPLDEMWVMLSKYEGHPAYRKGIGLVLSPQGMKWLEEFYQKASVVAASLAPE